jgi:hypothetical protein
MERRQLCPTLNVSIKVGSSGLPVRNLKYFLEFVFGARTARPTSRRLLRVNRACRAYIPHDTGRVRPGVKVTVRGCSGVPVTRSTKFVKLGVSLSRWPRRVRLSCAELKNVTIFYSPSLPRTHISLLRLVYCALLP